jgi:hypothetical protein
MELCVGPWLLKARKRGCFQGDLRVSIGSLRVPLCWSVGERHGWSSGTGPSPRGGRVSGGFAAFLPTTEGSLLAPGNLARLPAPVSQVEA